MKKLSLIALGILLVGCHHEENKPTTPTQITTTEKVQTKNLGEICGGKEFIKCKSGLQCRLKEKHPTSSGICVESVIDKELKCPATQVPVCGLKEGQKNGYLNECEAKRHGAKIISQGLCQIDKTVKNNCQAKVTGIGNCEKFTKGYEFNGNTCIEKGVSGCDAEIPFPSLKECQSTCEEQSSSKSAENPVICTMDAKICPNGSSVGRTGPNCEFAPCK